MHNTHALSRTDYVCSRLFELPVLYSPAIMHDTRNRREMASLSQ